ncbi:MAG: TIGR03790 family protein [Phycisphaerae bacterium]|jgi:uncharacterized protein (TIGR03790 family)
MTRFFSILFLIIFAQSAFALQPQQILVIANSDVNESVSLAEYYCQKRAVPAANILKIPLGITLSEQISRRNYDKILAYAVKKEIQENRKSDEIKCLLTVYGVPIKVGSLGQVKNADELVAKLSSLSALEEEKLKSVYHRLNRLGREELTSPQNAATSESYEDILKHLSAATAEALKRIEYIEREDTREKQYDDWIELLRLFYGPAFAGQQAEKLPRISFTLSLSEKNELYRNSQVLQTAEREKWTVEKKLKNGFYPALRVVGGLTGELANLKADIGRCKGTETSASVDSELSMVLYKDYDLYRWQKNELQNMPFWLPSKTLMVSRLDGPSAKIAAGLVDKAIKAEKAGLSGTAYIDARGLNTAGQITPRSFEFFDKSLHTLAAMLKKRTSMKVVVENTDSLFAPRSCPNTAIYCGWYSVKKYIDSFDFVPGAVGFHIASFEAMDLRNPASSNWCPALLSHGITATFGAVDEPYLHSFPDPDKFFAQLLNGDCMAEAFYATNPFNSWQLVLIGDPLYKLNIK